MVAIDQLSRQEAAFADVQSQRSYRQRSICLRNCGSLLHRLQRGHTQYGMKAQSQNEAIVARGYRNEDYLLGIGRWGHAIAFFFGTGRTCRVPQSSCQGPSVPESFMLWAECDTGGEGVSRIVSRYHWNGKARA